MERKERMKGMDGKMAQLFVMWKNQRMRYLVLFIALIYGAFLIAFKGLVLIPGFIGIRPANVIPVLSGVFFGPAGAWGAMAGNLIGDVFGGTWSAGSLFGALGNFLLGLLPWMLWNSLGLAGEDFRGFNRKEKQGGLVLNFILLSLVASAACSLTIGWGLELLGFFSFREVDLVLLLNNAGMDVVLGTPLFLLLGQSLGKKKALWGQGTEPSKSLPKVRPGGLLAAGASLGGFLGAAIASRAGSASLVLGIGGAALLLVLLGIVLGEGRGRA